MCHRTCCRCLLEAVSEPPYNGHADLPANAEALSMDVDELFPVAEALQLLRFAEIEGGDMKPARKGSEFVKSETDERRGERC